jgi:hypothetical protein
MKSALGANNVDQGVGDMVVFLKKAGRKRLSLMVAAASLFQLGVLGFGGASAAQAATGYYYVKTLTTDSSNGKAMCLTAIGSYAKILDCGGSADQQWFPGAGPTGEYFYNRSTRTVLTYTGRGNLMTLTTYHAYASQLFVAGDPSAQGFNKIRLNSSPSTCVEPLAFRKAHVYVTTAACDEAESGIQAFRTQFAGIF